jgi:hypothetical protein
MPFHSLDPGAFADCFRIECEWKHRAWRSTLCDEGNMPGRWDVGADLDMKGMTAITHVKFGQNGYRRRPVLEKGGETWLDDE